jgi:hypothetical protein
MILDDEENPQLCCHLDANFEPLDRFTEQEISKAVETILSESSSESNEQIASTFYKNIDTSEEFGVSRFVADRVYYLPKLLENTTLNFIQDTTYLISAEEKDPNGNSIKLEHRFKASDESEAGKLFEKIHQQLAGVQLKIWLACWRLGDQLRRYSYTCQLTDLMKIAYPERNGRFSVSDRTEFYDHLKSLEHTKLVFSKPKTSPSKPNAKKNTGSRSKDLYQSFEIPLLQIISRIGGQEDKYPMQISISILNLYPHPGKMAFVGTPIKYKTLELHADDTMLATWIQTRKAQRPEEEFLTVEREYLINLSSLQRTNASNKSMASKKLLLKLQRLAATGVIKSAPAKITNEVQLKIR